MKAGQNATIILQSANLCPTGIENVSEGKDGDGDKFGYLEANESSVSMSAGGDNVNVHIDEGYVRVDYRDKYSNNSGLDRFRAASASYGKIYFETRDYKKYVTL